MSWVWSQGQGSHLLWTWGCAQRLISNNAISAVFLVMLIICGVLVNGPYALITTAVSADLVSGPLVGTRLV
jgi:hypothetical protein